MTVAEAMGSIPDAVGDLIGERALARCLSEAGLPTGLRDQTVRFVPEIALKRFLQSAARRAGDAFLGATLARSVSVQDYGVWGDYVLEAPTLRSALLRAVSVIHLHADNDTLTLRQRADSVLVEYGFGERGGKGYLQVAMAAIGPLVSIPRHYLGEGWRPPQMGVDLDDKGAAKRLDFEFGCRVKTGDKAITIEIPDADLLAANPAKKARVTTREDVVRACHGGAPQGIVSILEQLLLQRLGLGGTNLEDIARTIGMSKRTLQRRLDQDGIDFRSLSSSVRMRRARELLVGSDLSVSEIATLLDYSTPSHFARAFQKCFGVVPTTYRHIGLG